MQMTAKEFIVNLETQFPQLKTDIQKQNELSIIEFIKKYSAEDIFKIYEYFLNTNEKDYPPKRGTFFKIVSLLNLYPKRETGLQDVKIPFNLCECLQEYPVHLLKCPKCDNADKSKNSIILKICNVQEEKMETPWKNKTDNYSEEVKIEYKREFKK